jgi:hypothetical protein
MELNWYIYFAAAIIPMIIGSIWYHPKVWGTVWMKAAQVTEETLQKGNMAVILGAAYILSLLVAFSLGGIVIHQLGVMSLFAQEPGFGEAGSETQQYFEAFMERFGAKHRHFGHGALHGTIAGLFFATPVIAIVANFERRGFRYIAVHAGYWTLSLMVMGGVLAQFL